MPDAAPRAGSKVPSALDLLMAKRGRRRRAARALVPTLLALAVLLLAPISGARTPILSARFAAHAPSHGIGGDSVAVSFGPGGLAGGAAHLGDATICPHGDPDGGGTCVVVRRVVSGGSLATGASQPTPEGRVYASASFGGADFVSSSASDAILRAASAQGEGSAASAPNGAFFDYVVIILMENHAICDILTSCGGAGPYETSLANAYGLATEYVDCTHPSLPNYLCLTGGSTFGCTGYDGGPHSNNCTNLAWRSPNIVDRLGAANLSWKAYMENMPSNCYGSNNGSYVVRHDPFVYYSDIASNTTQCARVIPAGIGDDALLDDLALTSNASNYMWLSPNICNDMHNCNVTTGDAYLANLVPQILNSTVFTTQRAALFITFDEDSKGKGAPAMYSVWDGPTVKTSYASSIDYNHSSLLATIEANWNLPPLTANDSGAANMSEFFVGFPSPPGHPAARFTYSPSWPQPDGTVTFNGSASSDPNPNATLQYRWDWTNDRRWDTPWSTSPVARHAYGTPGTYTAVLQVNDTLGLLDDAAQQLRVDGVPPITTASLSGPSGINGWYTGNVTVGLAATDDVSGVAWTNYSLDRGALQTYLGPFLVTTDGNHSLSYFSTDNADNIEATQTTGIKIDGTPPVTATAFRGTVNGSTFLTPINVTLLSSDFGSGVAWTRYNVDGGPWTTYAAPFNISNTGSHTVRYDSLDVAGNPEPTNGFDVVNGTISGFVGLSSKALFVGTSGSAGWYTSNVTVRFDATDASSGVAAIHYRVDDGPWQDYTGAFILVEGRHALAYYAVDVAGLVEAEHSASILIDTTPPTTTAVLSGTLGSNGWYISNVTVSLNATDASSGVASIFYRVDSGPWETYTGWFSLGDGRHAVEYYATDRAGNAEPAARRNISTDTMPPQSTITPTGTVGEDGWYISNVTISLNATDATSGVANLSYRIDTGSWASYAGPFALGEGRYQLEYYATDFAGHVEPLHTLAIRIDTTPPTTGFAPSGTPGDGGWYVSSVTVTLPAQDATSGVARVTYRVDNGSWQTYAGPFGLGEGRHSLEFFATDLAGLQETVRSASVSVDTTPPSTAASFTGVLGDHGWYVSNVSVTLNPTDGLGGVWSKQYRLDGGLWIPYGGPFVLSDDGKHVLEFSSVDRAGNGEPVRAAELDVEKSNPMFVFVSPRANVTTTPVSISWTNLDNDSEVVEYAVSVDGGPFTPLGTATNVTLDLSPGAHVIRVRATDPAGLTAEASLSLQVESGSGSVSSTGPPLVASIPFLMALDAASIGAAFAYVVLRIRRRVLSKRE